MCRGSADCATNCVGIHGSVFRLRDGTRVVKVVDTASEQSMRPHDVRREIRVLARTFHPAVRTRCNEAELTCRSYSSTVVGRIGRLSKSSFTYRSIQQPWPVLSLTQLLPLSAQPLLRQASQIQQTSIPSPPPGPFSCFLGWRTYTPLIR